MLLYAHLRGMRCYPSTDGYMGKLRIRRSGRMELVLGDIVFDVTSASTANYVQVAQTFMLPCIPGHACM